MNLHHCNETTQKYEFFKANKSFVCHDNSYQSQKGATSHAWLEGSDWLTFSREHIWTEQTHDRGPRTFGFAQCKAYKTSTLSTTNMLQLLIKIVLRKSFTIVMKLPQKYAFLRANKSSVVYRHLLSNQEESRITCTNGRSSKKITLVESWHMTKVKFEGPPSHLRFCTMQKLSNSCCSSRNLTMRVWKTIAAAPITSKLPSRYNKYLLVTILHLIRLQLQISTCKSPSQQPHQTPAAIPRVHKSPAPHCKRIPCKSFTKSVHSKCQVSSLSSVRSLMFCLPDAIHPWGTHCTLAGPNNLNRRLETLRSGVAGFWMWSTNGRWDVN